MNKELKMGIKVEAEHIKTIKYIKNTLKKTGKLPPNTEIYKHIAENHLSENKNYYKILKKAKL